MHSLRLVVEVYNHPCRGYSENVSTAEAIYESPKALPDQQQLEALHFVNFLLSQAQGQAEAAEWAAFSASQLARQYGSADSVYDQD